MKIKILNNIFYFFIFYFLLYITNTHFDFNGTIINGAADGQYYHSIAEAYPDVVQKKISPIHAERFLFPYLIGFLSNLFNINIFLSFKITTVLLLIGINIYLIKFFKFSKINEELILILLIILNLNPYFTRFYISNPTIITDLTFIFGFVFLSYSILRKNFLLFLIGYSIALFSRQSGVCIFVSFLIYKFFFDKEKNIKEILVTIILSIIIFYLVFLYRSNTKDVGDNASDQYSMLFSLLTTNYDFKNLIIFLLLPLLSFFPLIFFIIFNFNYKNYSVNKYDIFFILCIVLLIAQPILAGPNVAGKNIIRLTTLAYPAVLFLITNKLKNNFLFKKLNIYFVILIALFFSFHPTFSKIKIFNHFKIYLNQIIF